MDTPSGAGVQGPVPGRQGAGRSGVQGPGEDPPSRDGPARRLEQGPARSARLAATRRRRPPRTGSRQCAGHSNGAYDGTAAGAGHKRNRPGCRRLGGIV